MTVLFVGACFLPTPVLSQDKIQSWPVWQKYQKDNADQSGLIKTANAQARWVDATHLGYKRDDGWYVVELPSGKETKSESEPKAMATSPC